MKFVIESNIEMPALGRTGLTQDLRETMTDLKPGQCFTILVNKIRPFKKIRSAFFFLKQSKEFKDRRFTSATVKVGPTNADAVRIWAVPAAAPNKPEKNESHQAA